MTLEELRDGVARLLAAMPVSPETQCDIADRFDAAIRERDGLRGRLYYVTSVNTLLEKERGRLLQESRNG